MGLFFLAIYVWIGLTAPLGLDASIVEVTIRKGMTTRKALEHLKEKGLMRFPWLIEGWLRWQKRTIKWGTYRFTPPYTPLKTLQGVLRGVKTTLPITFPEGSDRFDMAKQLEAMGLGSWKNFLSLTAQAFWVRDLDPQAPSLEGFLYPDTYWISKETSEQTLIKLMLRKFRRIYHQYFEKKLQQQGKNFHTWLIVASLVEKETARKEERGRIAGVFYNRLNKKMRLQCDPTVFYAWKLQGVFPTRLLYKHLRKNLPYNTYRIRGLPPGPICNPGKASMEASLTPEKHHYLYFVSRNDGTHAFSSTLKAHNRYVQLYQKRQ